MTGSSVFTISLRFISILLDHCVLLNAYVSEFAGRIGLKLHLALLPLRPPRRLVPVTARTWFSVRCAMQKLVEVTIHELKPADLRDSAWWQSVCHRWFNWSGIFGRSTAMILIMTPRLKKPELWRPRFRIVPALAKYVIVIKCSHQV